MQYTLREIPGGLAGTDETVRQIGEHVQNDLKRLAVRLTASRLIQSAGVQSKDHLGEARAIYGWIARNIRYQKDPIGIEMVQSPEVTLRLRYGDCDDHVALVVAMALSVGIPARFRVIGYSQDNLVHIFPELLIDGKWIAADTTEPQKGFGWRPAKFPVERIYNYKGEVSDMTYGKSVANGMGALPANRAIIKRSLLAQAIKQNVRGTLERNWKAGVNNRNDLRSYIKLIDDQNFPTKQPIIVEPVREAIVEYLDYVDRNRIGSIKPESEMSGMGELSGFLSSIWNGVKSVVKASITQVAKSGIPIISQVAAVGAGVLFPSTRKARAGEPPPVPFAPIQIRPTITLPSDLIRTELAPGAAQAFGAGLGGATLPLVIAAGVALIFLMKK